MRRRLLPERPRPLVFAHRGLSAAAPENTMAAFAAARGSGSPGIELDVHLSSDGRLVVIHDDWTGRVEGGKPGSGLRVEASSYPELSALDVGSWKGTGFSGERIPLLEDVLEEFSKDLYIDIEIKSRSASDSGLELKLASILRAARAEGSCLVSSFNPFSIRRFRALCPEVPTAIIWTDSDELYWFLRRGQGRWIGCADALKPEHRLVNTRGSRARTGLLPSALPILPWTVDSEEEASRLLAAGVEGIISNDPRLLGLGCCF
ncbi:MAG TPA: glycerophosphodiester phosphodiesterase family protein [Rectinemataceae bacterium]